MTFQEMLEKMPFDKITVSAIVAKCEISSNTFYYHFRDIYDLLDKWLALKYEKYLSMLTEDGGWEDMARFLLSDLKAHSELVYHLFNFLSRERLERFVFDSSDDTFYHLVRKKTADANIPEPELRAIAEYNSYSFLGFLLKYLWNDMSLDIDSEIEKISYIFENNILWLREKYIREEAKQPK